RRAVEEGNLDTEGICHVGTRGPLYGKKDLEDDRRFGFGIVTSSDVFRQGVDEIIAKLRDRVGKRALYISVDIDVLDPAHAPGTGTPEAGGLTSRELLEIIRGLRGLNIVGADVVEVAPAYDHAELTGIAASHVAYDLITLMADFRADAAQKKSEGASMTTRNGGGSVAETLSSLGTKDVCGIPVRQALCRVCAVS